MDRIAHLRRTINTAAIGVLAGLGVGAAIATAVLGQPTQVAAAAQPEPVQPIVTVVDRTAGTWSGIAAAATSWDATEHLDIQVAARCTTDAYCVVFQAPTSYTREWLGYWQPISRHVSMVQLNSADKRATDPAVQQWIACHELGHALGLGEVYDGAPACMRDTWRKAGQQTTATGRDLHMLDQVAASRAPQDTALAYYAQTKGE